MSQSHLISSELAIYYQADEIDLHQVGTLNNSLHELLNQIAISMIESENDRRSKREECHILDSLPTSFGRSDILIRGRVAALKTASIEAVITPVLHAAAANPHVIALLQNLSANVVWAIGKYGADQAGIRIRNWKGDARDADVKGVAAKKLSSVRVRNLIKDLKDSSNGGRLKLKSGEDEIEIEFYGPRRK